MADVDRDLGEIFARLDQHERRLDRIDGKLDQLIEYAAKTKGGWWAIATVGAVGGAIVTGCFKLVAMVKGAG